MGNLNERMKDPAIAAGIYLAGMDVSHENKEDEQFSVALDNAMEAILRLKHERDRFRGDHDFIAGKLKGLEGEIAQLKQQRQGQGLLNVKLMREAIATNLQVGEMIPILQAYARQNPKFYNMGTSSEQDPMGVHALLEKHISNEKRDPSAGTFVYNDEGKMNLRTSDGSVHDANDTCKQCGGDKVIVTDGLGYRGEIPCPECCPNDLRKGCSKSGCIRDNGHEEEHLFDERRSL